MAKSKSKKGAAKKKEDQVQEPETPEIEGDEPEKEPEEEPEKKAGKEKDEEHDCRECANYPVTRDKQTTSFVEFMRIATNRFRKTFCGTQPVYEKGHKLEGKVIHSGIDCRQKKFEPLKK